MNTAVASPRSAEVSPIALLRNDIGKMSPQFETALPKHIPVDRFMRVVMTAIQNTPSLLNCDRGSLFNATMKAAQDGLLPDGREGAMVPFKGKVQWMPMVGGILKKVRNSGELKSITAHVVNEKDTFTVRFGDNECIEHVPFIDGDPGKVKYVYAIAVLKDGGIMREVMTHTQVEKVRAVSAAKSDGPWVSWWDEMAKKTVIRRLAKRLPMSTDLDDLIRQDDALYDFEAAREDARAAARSRPASAALLDSFASGGSDIAQNDAGVQTTPTPAHGGAGGESRSREDNTSEVPPVVGDHPSAPDPLDAAYQLGRKHAGEGRALRAMPADYRAEGREDEAAKYREGFKDFTEGR